MSIDQDTKRKIIRHLNDQLRKYGIGGEIVLTQGVQVLGEDAILQIMTLMQCFDRFSEDNDPYQEHDYGAFTWNGRRIFFKIDYYSLNYRFHSPNPCDPTSTRRVLTIMLAEEY